VSQKIALNEIIIFFLLKILKDITFIEDESKKEKNAALQSKTQISYFYVKSNFLFEI